jgi:hypothetical protein
MIYISAKAGTAKKNSIFQSMIETAKYKGYTIIELETYPAPEKKLSKRYLSKLKCNHIEEIKNVIYSYTNINLSNNKVRKVVKYLDSYTVQDILEFGISTDTLTREKVIGDITKGMTGKHFPTYGDGDQYSDTFCIEFSEKLKEL